MSDDSWEARMAARTREREHKRLAAEEAAIEERLPKDYDWLNGWPRIGRFHVLIGTGTHCIACGRLQGITCVAFAEDWEPPGPNPDWPFAEDDCPIAGCSDRSPFYNSAIR